MNDQNADKKIKELEAIISMLKSELEEREKALPVHSGRPHQLMAIEELEETIEEKEKELKDLSI